MPVSSPGSVVTRGLGSPLIASRGYGSIVEAVVIDVTVVGAPLPSRARSSDRRDRERQKTYRVSARLVRAEGRDREAAIEHVRTAAFEPGRPSVRLEGVEARAVEGMLVVEARFDSAAHGPAARVSASLPVAGLVTGSVVSAAVEGVDPAASSIVVVVGSVTHAGEKPRGRG